MGWHEPACVSEARSAATLLCAQFDVLVDPDQGRLIYARRCRSSSDQHHTGDVFVHCRLAATLCAKHRRLDRLLQVRARLQLTRLVAQQVRTNARLTTLWTAISDS